MHTKLHVAHLDLATEDAELGDLFSRHGVVRRAQVMAHRSLGSTTATGLVEMESDEQCAAAIAMLDGREHRGHALAVSRPTDVDHTVMFEAMNTPDDPALKEAAVPGPGGAGVDRGRGGPDSRPPVVASLRMGLWKQFLPGRWPDVPFSGRTAD